MICVANSPPTKRKRSWGKETPVRASILREILGQKRIFPKKWHVYIQTPERTEDIWGGVKIASIYRHLNGHRQIFSKNKNKRTHRFSSVPAPPMSIYRHLNGQRTFGQNSVLLFIDTWTDKGKKLHHKING